MCLLQRPSAEGGVWVLGNELGRREKQGGSFGWDRAIRASQDGWGMSAATTSWDPQKAPKAESQRSLHLRRPMVLADP